MSIDPSNFLSYNVWLSLPQETRNKIMQEFGLSFTVSRNVVDSRVLCDGVDPKNLAVITREKMQEITGLPTDDFYVLFQGLIDLLEGKTQPVAQPAQNNVQPIQQEEVKPTREVPARSTAKRGRPKKKVS